MNETSDLIQNMRRNHVKCGGNSVDTFVLKELFCTFLETYLRREGRREEGVMKVVRECRTGS